MTTRERRHPQRQKWWWWASMALICLSGIASASSGAPTEGQSQERLFAIAAQLKCQQCVGESVADSQSPSAIQFREAIADQMAEGSTDDEILNFFADRYDQEILLTPPSTGFGSLVWIVPVVALAAGSILLVGAFRRRRVEVSDRDVTEQDRERVAAAMRDRQP